MNLVLGSMVNWRTKNNNYQSSGICGHLQFFVGYLTTLTVPFRKQQELSQVNPSL